MFDQAERWCLIGGAVEWGRKRTFSLILAKQKFAPGKHFVPAFVTEFMMSVCAGSTGRLKRTKDDAWESL